jgi:hypothetical protein
LDLVESVLTLLFAVENAAQRNPTIRPKALEIGEGNVHPEPVDIPIEEATLPKSQVMEAIGQLVSAIDRDKVVR